MGLIDEFIIAYKNEYHLYKEIARLGQEILETEINNRGIKAIVSCRAKRPDRLKDKVEKRNVKKNYRDYQDVKKDIIDLAGIRVALYFPSERQIIGNIIEDLFDVVETKNFPENPYKPKHNKRFSGYWATHYRVQLKNGSERYQDKYKNIIFEIQVASVLMLAWSEVEHDLVYKPSWGELSEDELSILDEINGLVLAGEIAMERLQKAIIERTKRQFEIRNKDELTNLLFNNYKLIDENKLNFGNTEYIANYLKAVEKIRTSDIFKSLDKIDKNLDETFSDQFLNNIISITKSNDNLRKYFSLYTNDENKISGFEMFAKTWIIFEKAIFELYKENDSLEKKTFKSNMDVIKEVSPLSDTEIKTVDELRNVSSQILHGYGSFEDVDLKNSFSTLKSLTMKCINTIKNTKIKNELAGQLNQIR